MEIFKRSADIFPALESLVEDCREEFIAIGVSFDRSLKHHPEVIHQAMERGVRFRYVTLASNADLGIFSQQFGQTVDELKGEITASEAALTALRNRHPQHFNFHPTKRCPNYRLYVADPASERPRGIIVFYGSATDSPQLPAIRVADFKDSPFRPYLDDALRALQFEDNRRVFIIHGHSEAKWRELVTLLTQIGAEPVVLTEEPSLGSSTMIEKFERVAETCVFAIALVSGDDLVQKDQDSYYQSRPNVSFEIGWFVARLGRPRVLLVHEKKENFKTFSDFGGVSQLQFTGSVREVLFDIQAELSEQHVL